MRFLEAVYYDRSPTHDPCSFNRFAVDLASITSFRPGMLQSTVLCQLAGHCRWTRKTRGALCTLCRARYPSGPSCGTSRGKQSNTSPGLSGATSWLRNTRCWLCSRECTHEPRCVREYWLRKKRKCRPIASNKLQVASRGTGDPKSMVLAGPGLIRGSITLTSRVHASSLRGNNFFALRS